jgi:hypothetical protein
LQGSNALAHDCLAVCDGDGDDDKTFYDVETLSLSSSFHRLPNIFEISALWMVARPALSCLARIFRRSICDQRMKAFIGRLMCCPVGVEFGDEEH